MKIRTGFISNSSSSSFIIDQFDLYDYENNRAWEKDTIKEEVKNIYKKWLKNRKKNVKRDSVNYINHWKKYGCDSLNLEDVIKYKLAYYNDTHIDTEFDNCIYVDSIDKIKPLVEKLGATTLEYWYAGKELEKGNMVIFDPDNYLPDEVNKLIAKRFKIPMERRNHHMG